MAKIRPDYENSWWPRLMQWLKLYETIGIRNAVLHCDSMHERTDLTEDEIYAHNVAVLRQIQELSAGMKIRICLENLGKICRNADPLCAILDQLDPDRFGICLDTGHLNLNDKDQAGFIRKAGKRLRALHIADNEGERDQHMMPFGRGTVDFEKVVAALREIDYHGLFNLEIPGERLAPMPVRGYKLEYIRKCYEYLMGGETLGGLFLEKKSSPRPPQKNRSWGGFDTAFVRLPWWQPHKVRVNRGGRRPEIFLYLLLMG
mgnify:CR=1 FL=1